MTPTSPDVAVQGQQLHVCHSPRNILWLCLSQPTQYTGSIISFPHQTSAYSKQMAWPQVVVIVLSLFVIPCRGIDYKCPEECTCSRRDTPDLLVDVFCTILTVNEKTNFGLFETTVNSTLHLECDSILNSRLTSYMFKDLHTFSELKFENCRFDHIPKDAFSGMTSFEKLTILNARSLTFDPDAFRSCPTLKHLSIISSGVTSVSRLCENRDLVYLNLTGNHIKSIADAGLQCGNNTFMKLRSLVLSFNEFEYLGPELAAVTPNLWELSILHNQIDLIDPEAFWTLEGLHWLDLSGNRLQRLPPYLLRKQVNLQLISLQGNSLRRIPEGFFGYSTKLRAVALGNCSMDDRIWTELWPLREITELQLQYNNISKLDREALLRFDRIFYLDLTGNEIRHLHENLLSKQSQLEKLKLGKNRIEVIEKDAFKGLSNVSELDLRNNNITQAHNESFLPLHSVSLLNISFNSLSEIPSLRNMKNLNLADFRFNLINSLETETFEGLHGLQGVSFAFNNIKTIPRDVFNKPSSLQILNLANNDIDTIESEAFSGANELRWLFLQHNNISDIAWQFSALHSLLHLDISFNALPIQINGEEFPSSLQEINLAKNKITSIAPYAFYKFKSLRKVDIRYNDIQQLNSLSISVSSALHSTPPTFFIAGNQFVCDCKLRWLRQKMENTRPAYGEPIIYDLDVILCKQGYQAAATFLYKLDPENMLCNYEEECVMSKCRCCDYTGCVCRFVCPDKCSCYRSLDHSTTNYIICTERNLTNIPVHMPSVSTQIWMDGNNFTSLGKFSFLGLEFLKILHLNNSGIEVIQNGSFIGLKNIESLNLHDNMIEQILYGMLDGLETLIELNLKNNKISFIDFTAFEHTPNLQRLYIAYNELKSIPDPFLLNPLWQHLTLAGNPWICECDFLTTILQGTYSIVEKIDDRKNIKCIKKKMADQYENEDHQQDVAVRIVDVNMEEMCPNVTLVYSNLTLESRTRVVDRSDNIPLIFTIVAIVFIFIVFGLLLWKKNIVQVFCFSKFGCRLFHEKSDNSKMYDAFISYSHKDEDFVVRELVPKLEDVDHRFKLCVHYRDFPLGASISETIVNSVERSRRTVLIVSDNFLKSEWCQYEFQAAHHQVLKDKVNRVIVILLSDIDTKDMSADLKLYMKTRTYVKYGDPWFWEKLYFAMPDIKHRVTPVDRILDIRPGIGNGNIATFTQDDEGYETPISRVSSVHRQTCDFSSDGDTVGNFNIYEEIHPIEKSEKQMA